MSAYVRVEVNHKRQYVEIEDVEQLTFHRFVKIAVDQFQVENVSGKKVYIFDQLDTRIGNDAILKHLVKSKNENMILKLEFKENNASNEGNFTPKDIQEYLNVNGKDILKEYHELQTLTEKMRHKLVNCLVDMLVQRFGLYPKSFEKTTLAKAVIVLFPKFKVEDTQHGTELFYNPSKNSGWFIPVLRARRRNGQNKDANDDESDEVNGSDTCLEYSEENAKADIELLRQTLVHKSTWEIFEQKLKSTIEYRNKICDDENINLLERFPYFFTNPELILLDFDQRFGLKSNIFLEGWDKCKEKMKFVYGLHEKTSLDTDFDEETENFLMLLKLLTERQKGRKTQNIRLLFDKLVEKFVVFSKIGEPLEHSYKKENTQPYIIATGFSPKQIIRYYIVIDRDIMNVDKKYSFAQTFDLLYKTHYAFNLTFDENLTTLMQFIGHFFYKIPSEVIVPTPRMIRIHNELQAQN